MILLQAWISMLLIGATHHDLDGRVPALGYLTVVILATAVRFALAGLPTETVKKADKSKPILVNQTFNTIGKARA